MFVTAGIDLKFHSWPEESDEHLAVYNPSIRANVRQVSWCNDNNYLMLLPENGNPEIIATRNKRNIRLIHTIQCLDQVTASAFQKTTKRCLSLGTQEGQIALYDTKNRAITKLFTNLKSGVKQLDFNVDDMYLAAACENGIVNLFGVTDGDFVENYKLPSLAEPTVMRFHPHVPKYLAAATINGSVAMWDLNSTRKVFCVQSHSSSVSGLALSGLRGILVSVGDDHKLCVYDLNINECLFRSNLNQPLSTVDLKSDGNLLGVGLEDGFIHMYDMRKLIQPVYSLKSHDTSVNKILFAYNTLDSDTFSETSSGISLLSGLNINPDDPEASLEVPNSTPDLQAEKEKLCDITQVNKVKEEVLDIMENRLRTLSLKVCEQFRNFKGFLENEFFAIDNTLESKCHVAPVSELEETVDEINE